jgi:hypothetical protein
MDSPLPDWRFAKLAITWASFPVSFWASSSSAIFFSWKSYNQKLNTYSQPFMYNLFVAIQMSYMS